MKTPTIPANEDMPCDCCMRVHRKLFFIDGHWLGATCAEQYGFYLQTKDITNIVWRGYEKQYMKVARMVEGVAS